MVPALFSPCLPAGLHELLVDANKNYKKIPTTTTGDVKGTLKKTTLLGKTLTAPSHNFFASLPQGLGQPQQTPAAFRRKRR